MLEDETIKFLFAVCMHLAALVFFYGSNHRAVPGMGGKAACRERVPVVGNDELPGLSAKLSLLSCRSCVLWLGSFGTEVLAISCGWSTVRGEPSLPFRSALAAEG